MNEAGPRGGFLPAKRSSGQPSWGLKNWLLLPFGVAGVLWLFVLAWMLVGWWSIPAWLTLGVGFWKRDPEEVVQILVLLVVFGLFLSVPFWLFAERGLPGLIVGLLACAFCVAIVAHEGRRS